MFYLFVYGKEAHQYPITLSCNLSYAGVPSTRWKAVQQSGRLGRDPSHQSIYITVYETNKSQRGMHCIFFTAALFYYVQGDIFYWKYDIFFRVWNFFKLRNWSPH